MARWLTAVLGGLLLLSACSREGAVPSDPVLALVGDEPITRSEFERFYRAWRRSGPRPSEEEALTPEQNRALRLEAFQELVQRRLFLKEANRLGLTVTPQEEQAYRVRVQGPPPQGTVPPGTPSARKVREDLLIEKLLRRELGKPVQVTEREIRTYYRAHRKEFNRPAQVRARHIVVATREEAEAILQALKAGQAFEALARKHSLGPEKDQGGDLGWFGRGQMPEPFERAIFALRVGQVSPVIQTPYGYHLFKLEARRRAGIRRLKEVREEIREILIREKQEERFYRWKEALQKRFRVVIRDTRFLEG